MPECGGHVNEQWPSYWASFFDKNGMKQLDVVRPAIWTEEGIEWWYRQNTMIYSRSPAVFEAVGYDADRYTGFAFGVGIERLALRFYGIDDIRMFYENDLRFLRQLPL